MSEAEKRMAEAAQRLREALAKSDAASKRAVSPQLTLIKNRDRQA